MHREVALGQPLLQRVAGKVQDDFFADVDGVAGEVRSVEIGYREPLMCGNARLNNLVARGIERLGVVEEIAALQRTETRIEMEEAGLERRERLDFDLQQGFKRRDGARAGADAVTEPE